MLEISFDERKKRALNNLYMEYDRRKSKFENVKEEIKKKQIIIKNWKHIYLLLITKYMKMKYLKRRKKN